jgi:hypothetical protein
MSAAKTNCLVSCVTIRVAIKFVEDSIDEILDTYDRIFLERQAIPNRDAGDRIIRSETAAERSLTRAENRLDQLQRRRKERAAVERTDRLISRRTTAKR